MSKNRDGTSKEVRQLIKAAEGQGWLVRRTKSDHIQFRPPDKTKPLVISSLTASDFRSYEDLKKNLRHSGLKL